MLVKRTFVDAAEFPVLGSLPPLDRPQHSCYQPVYEWQLSSERRV